VLWLRAGRAQPRDAALDTWQGAPRRLHRARPA